MTVQRMNQVINGVYGLWANGTLGGNFIFELVRVEGPIIREVANHLMVETISVHRLKTDEIIPRGAEEKVRALLEFVQPLADVSALAALFDSQASIQTA